MFVHVRIKWGDTVKTYQIWRDTYSSDAVYTHKTSYI